jgi:hypothetical protein
MPKEMRWFVASLCVATVVGGLIGAEMTESRRDSFSVTGATVGWFVTFFGTLGMGWLATPKKRVTTPRDLILQHAAALYHAPVLMALDDGRQKRYDRAGTWLESIALRKDLGPVYQAAAFEACMKAFELGEKHPTMDRTALVSACARGTAALMIAVHDGFYRPRDAATQRLLDSLLADVS